MTDDALRLVYCSDARIPSRSSNSMQVMRMCAAFAAHCADLTLVHPNTPGPVPEGFTGDTPSFYGVDDSFTRHSLPVLTGPSVRWQPLLSRSSRLAAVGGYLMWRSSPGQPSFACYARSTLAAWAASRARRAWGERTACKAILLEVHDEPRDHIGWRVPTQVDAVVATSDALRSRLLEGLGSPGVKIWVEHNGVDLGAVDRRRLGRAEARSRLGISSPEGPLVVYTGRATRAKGVAVMLAAASKLQEIRARILIVGKVYDPDFERYAARNVAFTGFVPPAKVPDYLAAADVLVMPSTEELPYAAYTSPLKLFQYMASGRPVAASNLPVLTEILRDEENALLYPAHDPAALAVAVERAWSDHALAARITEQAWCDVQRYSWNRRARRILNRISGSSPGADAPVAPRG